MAFVSFDNKRTLEMQTSLFLGSDPYYGEVGFDPGHRTGWKCSFESGQWHTFKEYDQASGPHVFWPFDKTGSVI